MSSQQKLLLTIAVCMTIIGMAASIRLEQEYEAAHGLEDTATKSNQSQDKQGQGVASTPPLLAQAEPYISAIATSTEVAMGQKPQPEAPTISAEAYIVGDVHTGEVFLQSGASRILPVASLTKLVTAIVAFDDLTPTPSWAP